MKEWLGKIVIGKISNEQPASSNGKSLPQFSGMEEKNVLFVHYPDCQQMIIWLPQPGREYGYVHLYDIDTGACVEEWPASKHLNGSIQLLWDTLPIPPGNYTMTIDWKNDCGHHIAFVKYPEGYTEEVKVMTPISNKPEKVTGPIVYRDGFGNIIENEDLALRDKLNRELNERFSRHIEYKGSFRAGYIIYIEGDTRIEFSHEMGGGNCMFYIEVPTEKKWEAATGSSLSKRAEILQFVANTVNREQASNCRFVIGEDTITYFYH